MNIGEQVKELRELADCYYGEIKDHASAISQAADTIESLSAKLKAEKMERLADGSGWIPCSERLPDEPETLPTEDDFIERMILDGEFEEYNVTIYGAEKATTLYYIGNGSWYDELSNECYKVIAWQPLPEPYREEES